MHRWIVNHWIVYRELAQPLNISVYVCMYVYMYVCMYVCMYVQNLFIVSPLLMTHLSMTAISLKVFKSSNT